MFDYRKFNEETSINQILFCNFLNKHKKYDVVTRRISHFAYLALLYANRQKCTHIQEIGRLENTGKVKLLTRHK